MAGESATELRPLLGEPRGADRILLVKSGIGELVLDRVDALAEPIDQRLGRLDLFGERLQRGPPLRSLAPPLRLGCLLRFAPLLAVGRIADNLLPIVRQ